MHRFVGDIKTSNKMFFKSAIGRVDMELNTVKKELVDKLRQRYRDMNGTYLPNDLTDDEIIYTVLLWLIDELI